jgi:hypothetical protein
VLFNCNEEEEEEEEAVTDKMHKFGIVMELLRLQNNN